MPDEVYFLWTTEWRVFLFEIFKYAIKSGTVARLTSSHDANCVSRLEARRHAACRRRVRLRTVRRDSRRIRRSYGVHRGSGKCEEATSPSFGSTGRADSCAGVTHASIPSAYVIKALECRLVFYCVRTALPCSRQNRWCEVGTQIDGFESRRALLCKAWPHEFFNTSHAHRRKIQNFSNNNYYCLLMSVNYVITTAC